MAIVPIDGVSPAILGGSGGPDYGARQIARFEASSGAIGQVLVDGQRPTPTMSVDGNAVKNAVEEMNRRLRDAEVGEELEFLVDKETGTQVVRLLDSKSRQVLRQFPSEELLAIRKSIDRFKGLFLEERA